MKRSELEEKSNEQLYDLYYQSGGKIDVDHHTTREELVEALLTGNKLIGYFEREDGMIY